jgi:hypothetical protein
VPIAKTRIVHKKVDMNSKNHGVGALLRCPIVCNVYSKNYTSLDALTRRHFERMIRVNI